MLFDNDLNYINDVNDISWINGARIYLCNKINITEWGKTENNIKTPNIIYFL